MKRGPADQTNQAIVLVSAVTSADGDPAGTYLICSAFIGKPDTFTGRTVLITSGADANDLTDITAFNPLTGQISVAPSFNTRVLRNCSFLVLNNEATANLLSLVKAKTDNIPAGPATEATSQTILAQIGGSGINFADDHSVSGFVEIGGVIHFGMSVTDLSTGPVPAANIDLTGVTATLYKSTGGAAFSSVGITQPVFGKVDGEAFDDYLFNPGEWSIGDTYKLTFGGLASHVGASVFYSHSIEWSGQIFGSKNTVTQLAAIKSQTDLLPANPASQTNLDVAVSTRAAPGAQMALTAAEETAVQGKILSDATPFPGANVDAKVSTRATQAQILSDATPFAGANIPAIKAKTDLIPADIATQLDTNIPAIKAKTDLIPADIGTQLDTNIPAIKTNTDLLPAVYHQQASVPVNINAIAAGETDFLNLSTAGVHYDLGHLRLKVADPGANAVYVRLYELVNNVSTLIDTYTVTGSLDPVEQTYTLYLNLMDMFGMPDVQGDNLRITVQATAGGPYAVTGQYEYAEAT